MTHLTPSHLFVELPLVRGGLCQVGVGNTAPVQELRHRLSALIAVLHQHPPHALYVQQHGTQPVHHTQDTVQHATLPTRRPSPSPSTNHLAHLFSSASWLGLAYVGVTT